MRVASGLLRLLVRTLPSSLGDRHGEEILGSFVEELTLVRRDRGWWDAIRYSVRAGVDVIRVGHVERRRLRRERRKETHTDNRDLPNSQDSRTTKQRGHSMHDLRMDIRLALRGFIRRPGFTAIALAVLTLGIGATTAIFSVIQAVLVQPLPFHDPDRLVQVFESHLNEGYPRFAFSQPNARDVQAMATQFEGVGAYMGRAATITGVDAPQAVSVGQVTPGFFTTLGVTPLQGRTFVADDIDAGQATFVALLSEAVWRTQYGADPRILGRSIELDGQSHQIVGVLPGNGPWLGASAYVPLFLDPESSRSNHRLSVIGRLADGATLETARSELTGLSERLMESYSAIDEGMGFDIASADGWVAGETLRRSLWIFMGATLLVLLISCMNLANLQFARFGAQIRQVTLRAALGATKGRIVRQLLTEAALLGFLGGAFGLLLAYFGLRGLIALEPGNIPRLADVQLDMTVLGFALVVSLVAGTIAGLLPAMRVSATDLASALRDSGHRTSGGAVGSRARGWLVGAETAVSLVLLIGAGLLIRSLGAVQDVDNGFETEGRVTFTVPMPAGTTLPEANGFRTEFLTRLRSHPEIRSAAAVSIRPILGGRTVLNILPAEETGESFGGIPAADWRAVSDDYFTAMGLSFVEGRGMDHIPPGDGDWQIVLSKGLADEVWPGESAIGKRASLWNPPNAYGTVVGVVEDMREQGPEAGETSIVYFSYVQSAWSPVAFVVEAQGDPTAVVPSIRTMLAEVNPNLPVSGVMTMDEMVQASSASRRFTMTLLGVFAGLALLLALAGLYGVITQSVSQRARELGVRSALGASSDQIVALVMRQGMIPAGIGIAVGLVATFALSRVLEALLFGVSPTDPLTYAGVGMLLALAAAAACWVPARAALRLDPAVVLRDD